MENFECFDKDVLKLLKSYTLVKSDVNLIKLADELETFDKNLSHQQKEKFQILADIDKELTFSLNSISKLQNIKSVSLLTKTGSELSISNKGESISKKIRIFMDGVFDIIHSGHFNALRQGRKFGDILVVGINSDADVEKAKGPTLMNVNERAALVAACKWVDEVVIDTPYTPTLKLLDDLNIDFCSHGDDPCFNENGEDVYTEMKKQNRFKVFRRTEGISTTEIIGRLLMLSKENSSNQSEISSQVLTSSELVKKANEDILFSKGPVVSSFLTTGWRLQEFCNHRFPNDDDKVVYIDGAFDILHIGHVETLKKAKELGTFLYVGVHDDATVNKHRGKNYPILNLQERILNLLALRYVDDVVIGAPWSLTEDLIKSLKIDIVVQGTSYKYDVAEDINANIIDPYEIPKKLGIYHEVKSQYDLTNDVLVERLITRRENYIKKYQNKSKKEQEYYKQKEYVSEV